MILLSGPNTYCHSIWIILVAAELGHHHTDSSAGDPTTTILLWTHKWAKEVVITDDCMR